MATQVVEKLAELEIPVETGEKIPPGYLQREQVMELLSTSETGVERRTRTGQLDSKLFPVPGRRHIRYYTEESVLRLQKIEALKRTERPPSALARSLPAAGPSPGPSERALAVPDKSIALLNQLIENWVAALKPPASVPLTEKLWLTLAEAAEYSGLPERFLKRLAQEGKLTALKARAWLIHRRALEEYAG